MAPNRKRGAGKAAAASVAARRQWKVGDLVLAKVKGFPAWPATVSEPEKWGYAADWKKVLVYFFGTQQIAFCNPADVEAFTEEKRQSLLVKRQGKGADFVRAVQEIIDCYEKLKKSDQVDDLNSGEEVTLANGGHSVELSDQFESRDRKGSSEANVSGKDDPNLASGNAPDAPQGDSLHDKKGSLEQPLDNVAVKSKTSIATYTSRKRSGGLRSRKRATQKDDSSVERSGSLSRLDSSRFQNFLTSSNEGKKRVRNISIDAIPSRSLQRNKRSRKSPDTSEWEDVDSSALVSNGSVEDDASEIVTNDSDSLSLNEGSTVDSASKPEHSESFVECQVGDTGLSKGLDFQIKAARKRRKPTRKRTADEAAEPPARLEAEACAGVQNSEQTSQSGCENLNLRHKKEDGDEHLPLVKRARVRMGKLSSFEENGCVSQAEEKPTNEVDINPTEVNNSCQSEERTSKEVTEHVGQSTNSSDDYSTKKDSLSVKGALQNASPPKACVENPENRLRLLIVKETGSFGCSADGEAALPPSKRLHRALEAMSANVAEEDQAGADASPTKTAINDGSACVIKGISNSVIESEETSGTIFESKETSGTIFESEETNGKIFESKETNGKIFESKETKGTIFESEETKGTIFESKETTGSDLVIESKETSGSDLVIESKETTGSDMVIESKETKGSNMVVEAEETNGSDMIVETEETNGSALVIGSKETNGFLLVIESRKTNGSDLVIECKETNDSDLVIESKETKDSNMVIESKETKDSDMVIESKGAVVIESKQANGCDMMTESKEANGFEEQSTESLCHRNSLPSSSNGALEKSTRSLINAEIGNEPAENSNGQRHSEEALVDDNTHQDVSGSCLGGRTEEIREIGIKNPDEDVHELNSGLVSLADEATRGTFANSSDVIQYTADRTSCKNAETLRSQIDDNSQTNSMCEDPKGVDDEQRQKESHYTSSLGNQLDGRDVLVVRSSPVPAESKGFNYEQIKKDSCYASSNHFGGNDALAVQSSLVPADGLESPAQTSPPTASLCHVSTAESANFVQNGGVFSPNHLQHKTTVSSSVVDEEKTESVAPQRPKSVGKGTGYAEAHAALSSFEGMLGSLTRTKESIGRATRIAIDCAKFGVSSKVMEVLARTLESESSLHRRVDLFFLVDSIAQCSRGLKGDVGGIYPSAIQAVLPRLLSAAAAPGSSALENRRQCLKVLRLWLERRILPDYVIRQHMRELDPLGGPSSSGAYSRRSARTERPLDDPVREMEGMLVDEYGSNSSFQLPGFCMPRMLKDEDVGSDSDGESFEAVTPEHNSGTPEEHANTPIIEKHTCILEDVDGELEMEDVAPSCEVEASFACGIPVDAVQNSQNQVQQHFSVSFAPPLPQDVPPLSPPLPTSPPPPPPPPPLPSLPSVGPPLSGMHDTYVTGIDSKLYTNPHELHGETRESMALRLPPSMSNGTHYHATECRDQMQMQHSDSTNSFNGYPGCHAQHTDGPNFHHKAYPPRPPHPPPSNQFSYVQAGLHAKARRGSPPSYHDRYQSSHYVDGNNFYNNQDRMRPAPYEESWRYPPPPFPGPRYPDKPYPPGPYDGPPREPSRMPHQGWSHPPRSMHHRNYMSFGPPESAVPVSNRAPGGWRPR